jgi:DNA-binding NarL/FixJ family response regulator
VNSCQPEQRLFAELLKEEPDIVIEPFESGVHVLRELKTRDPDRFPDLLVVPFLLPLLTSAEFITALKADPRLYGISIVVFDDVPTSEAALLYRLGARWVLSKGITLESFEDAVEKLKTCCIRRQLGR